MNLNPKTIYTLGPEGTFSDQAAQLICQPHTEVIYGKNFAEVLMQIESHPDSMAVVPFENSIAGTVTQVQELIANLDLIILGEIQVPIHFALLSNVKEADIEFCYAHPQAANQSSQFMLKHALQAVYHYTNSNIESGQEFLEAIKRGENASAIVPMAYSKGYQDYIIGEEIQDYENNTTRFLVVRKKHSEDRFNFTEEKTSILLESDADRPGLLFDILKAFDRYNINLCRVESRPSKKVPWFYVFYIDFTNTPDSAALLEGFNTDEYHYQILGSFSKIKF